jgi:hypothetical protein
MSPHLIIKENLSNNTLNKLFIDFDNDLYNTDNNSNGNGNLPVQEVAAVNHTDNEGIDIVQYTSVYQFESNVCPFIR